MTIALSLDTCTHIYTIQNYVHILLCSSCHLHSQAPRKSEPKRVLNLAWVDADFSTWNSTGIMKGFSFDVACTADFFYQMDYRIVLIQFN